LEEKNQLKTAVAKETLKLLRDYYNEFYVNKVENISAFLEKNMNYVRRNAGPRWLRPVILVLRRQRLKGSQFEARPGK
jgi:hypothetical protein